MRASIWIKRLRFLFKRPKYQLGDLIQIAGVSYDIIGVRRSWKYASYFYRIGDNFSASESIVDLYNEN